MVRCRQRPAALALAMRRRYAREYAREAVQAAAGMTASTAVKGKAG